jgi:ABC-type branched-subunit amino acid transport system ATPase component
MIDDCINRPLITAEAVGMSLTRRINELVLDEPGLTAKSIIINELTKWRDRIDLDINEMLNEQSFEYQNRVKEQAIEM